MSNINFNNSKIKEIIRKSKVIASSITSLNYINEFMLWTKQALINLNVENINNDQEIIKKAISFKNTVTEYLTAQLELINKKSESHTFLIDCESLFEQEDYLDFRIHWFVLLNIINENDKDNSLTKINKLKAFSKFWRKYLFKSQNFQEEK